MDNVTAGRTMLAMSRSRDPVDWLLLADLLEDQIDLAESQEEKDSLAQQAITWREMSVLASSLLPDWRHLTSDIYFGMKPGERVLRVSEFSLRGKDRMAEFTRTRKLLKVTIIAGWEQRGSSFAREFWKRWNWEAHRVVTRPASDMKKPDWKLLRYKLTEILGFIRSVDENHPEHT